MAKFPENFQQKLKNLIEKCRSHNIDERTSFDEIYSTLSKDFTYLEEKLDEIKILEYIREIIIISTTNEKLQNKVEIESTIKHQINNLITLFRSPCEKNGFDKIQHILSLKVIDANTRFIDAKEQKTALYIVVENCNYAIVELLKHDTIGANTKSYVLFPFEPLRGIFRR